VIFDASAVATNGSQTLLATCLCGGRGLQLPRKTICKKCPWRSHNVPVAKATTCPCGGYKARTFHPRRAGVSWGQHNVPVRGLQGSHRCQGVCCSPATDEVDDSRAPAGAKEWQRCPKTVALPREIMCPKRARAGAINLDTASGGESSPQPECLARTTPNSPHPVRFAAPGSNRRLE
jgi:hypothetical protein